MLLRVLWLQNQLSLVQLHFQQFATGATLGPMDSFSVSRYKNASFTNAKTLWKWKVAAFLNDHPKVKTVYS
jgi:cystathionine beta-lyase